MSCIRSTHIDNAEILRILESDPLLAAQLRTVVKEYNEAKDTSPGQPSILAEQFVHSEVSSSHDSHQKLLKDVLHELVHDYSDVYVQNPTLKFSPTADDFEATVLYGLPQSGKTKEICLLAWIAHFVYGVVPIILTKLAGGRESKQQFAHSMHEFNVYIDEVLTRLRPGIRGERAKFHLYPRTDKLDADDFNEGRAQVLLRTAGMSNLELILYGKILARRKDRRPKRITGDLAAIRKLYDDYERKYGITPVQDGKIPIFLLVDEADTLVQSSGRNRGEAEKLAFGLRLMQRQPGTPAGSSHPAPRLSSGAGASEPTGNVTPVRTPAESSAADVEAEEEADEEAIAEIESEETNTTQTGESEQKLEEQIGSLIGMARYVTYISATPASILLTGGGKRYEVGILPIASPTDLCPYYGYSQDVQEGYRIQHMETEMPAAKKKRATEQADVEPPELEIITEEVAASAPPTQPEHGWLAALRQNVKAADLALVQDNYPGILTMVHHLMESFSTDGSSSSSSSSAMPAEHVQRMALVLCERKKKEHQQIQAVVATLAASHGIPAIVLTHNSGEKKDEGISVRITPDLGGDVLLSLACSVAPPVRTEAAAAGRQRSTQKIADGSDLTYSFGAEAKLVEVLDAVQSVLSRQRAIVVIISGGKGNRGTVFKSSDRVLHLTDQYISLKDGTSQHYGIQLASRICGRYSDRPALRLWCTRRDYDWLLEMVAAEDEIVRRAQMAAREGRSAYDALMSHTWEAKYYIHALPTVALGGNKAIRSFPDGLAVVQRADRGKALYFLLNGAFPRPAGVVLESASSGAGHVLDTRVAGVHPWTQAHRDEHWHVPADISRQSSSSSGATPASSPDAEVDMVGIHEEGGSSTEAAVAPAASSAVSTWSHDPAQFSFLCDFDADQVASVAKACAPLKRYDISYLNVATKLLKFPVPDEIRAKPCVAAFGSGKCDTRDPAIKELQAWLQKKPELTWSTLLPTHSEHMIDDARSLPLPAITPVTRQNNRKAYWRYCPQDCVVYVICHTASALDIAKLPRPQVLVCHVFRIEAKSNFQDQVAYIGQRPSVQVMVRVQTTEADPLLVPSAVPQPQAALEGTTKPVLTDVVHGRKRKISQVSNSAAAAAIHAKRSNIFYDDPYEDDIDLGFELHARSTRPSASGSAADAAISVSKLHESAGLESAAGTAASGIVPAGVNVNIGGGTGAGTSYVAMGGGLSGTAPEVIDLDDEDDSFYWEDEFQGQTSAQLEEDYAFALHLQQQEEDLARSGAQSLTTSEVEAKPVMAYT